MRAVTIACNRSVNMVRAIARASIFGWPLAMTLAVLMPAFSGCTCPEPRYPRYPAPVVDSPEHVRFVETTINNAKTRGVWTAEDEQAFSQSMPMLSAETRFEMGRQIAVAINTKAMVRQSRNPKGQSPPKCPCGRCDGATVPYQPPPTTTGARPLGGQPSAPGMTTAPAIPAAKQPQAPTRAPQ